MHWMKNIFKLEIFNKVTKGNAEGKPPFLHSCFGRKKTNTFMIHFADNVKQTKH